MRTVRFPRLGLILWISLAGFLQADESLLKSWHSGFVAIPGTELRMHKFETTQDIFRLATGYNPSRWYGEDHSVEVVSWDDAVAFCKQVTELLRGAGLIQKDQEVRLPSGEEWEFACRAGTKTAYSFGDDLRDLDAHCWYTDNAAGNDPPSGAKKPNPWGLFDMHGYVWEWVSDTVGDERVIRGGAWTSKAEECRSDSRAVVNREARVADIGFRCVLSPVGKGK